jgi:four helix bundle protein
VKDSDTHGYRQLLAWQKAMDAYVCVCDLTALFPSEERFGITQQIRRCSLSVPSNIAEGYGRYHRREYLHHLYMARGSLMEVETQLIAAARRSLCEREQAASAWEMVQETGRLLNGLIKSLNNASPNSEP